MNRDSRPSGGWSDDVFVFLAFLAGAALGFGAGKTAWELVRRTATGLPGSYPIGGWEKFAAICLGLGTALGFYVLVYALRCWRGRIG